MEKEVIFGLPLARGDAVGTTEGHLWYFLEINRDHDTAMWLFEQ